jgi:aminoglycoside 6'-N-acetyltransferase
MDALEGKVVRLRPLERGDIFALRRIVATPEVASWWGRQAEGFPLTDEPTATRFTVLVDDEIVGMAQYGEESEPDYRHAWIDLFLDPRRHGEGLGTDAVATLARHLVADRGHHRITIDPALHNLAAIRCYEKAGFERVGVTRSSWRDPDGVWRDGLLMELVVPARPPGVG